MIRNANDINAEQIKVITKRNETPFFKSSYLFLKQINGLRPGRLHVIMGTTGSGKSTLVRSILCDHLRQNSSMAYAWLSEESSEDLIVSLAKQGISENDRSKLVIESELENDGAPVAMILKRAEAHGAKLLLIDNLTTSPQYDNESPNVQKGIVKQIKDFAHRTKIAVLIVVHTKKDISDNYSKLITEADVRGNAAITMNAEFFYIMQRMTLQTTIYPTIKIVKHRNQDPTDKVFYLKYDSKERAYPSDRAITFEDFKLAFNARNKL